MKRWKNFLRQTDFESRFRLLALMGLPLWVCTLPLFHFAIFPWLGGFLLPYTMTGLFRRSPNLQVYLVLGMVLSCFVAFQFRLSNLQTTLLCGWAWFALAFAAGTQWWTLSSDD